VNDPGLRFSESSSLVAHALSLIEEKPQHTSKIAGRVFGLRNGPPGLAARLVFELLAEDHRVEVDGDGVWRLAAAPSSAEQRLDAVSFAVVDVETTGVPVSRGGRIIEIALAEVRGGVIRDEFTTLVNPDRHVPRWVAGLTGISGEMVAHAPRFRDICDDLRERLEGRVFVAHNAAYDWAYVSAEIQRSRMMIPNGPRLCTVRLARKALPGLHRRGLDSLARYYGIEIDGRHRAWGDARATALLLIRLLAEVERAGVEHWAELQSWMSERPKRRRRRRGIG
jgi:DNA polymerase-3 subunit epsilon